MSTQNQIYQVRRSLGLSQQGLAVKANTSPAIITLIEKYGHYPGEDLRQRIAAALDVSVEELWPDLTEAVRK